MSSNKQAKKNKTTDTLVLNDTSTNSVNLKSSKDDKHIDRI